MRTALVASAVLLASLGPLPALLPLCLAGAVHVARSPERIFDALYLAAFCGMGYLAG